MMSFSSTNHPFPHRKKAAVVFSIDDCHPARTSDGYEAGGDLEAGGLGLLKNLLTAHSQLKCTLFVTADWREIVPYPTRRLIAHMPWLRNHFYLADQWPEGKMRLDRYPEFIRYLKGLPRTEIASHGLHHTGRGLGIVKEFAFLDERECGRRLNLISEIFEQAGLQKPRGFAPPGWAFTNPLLSALESAGYRYVASARDLETLPSHEAVCASSGLQGVSLLFPQFLEGSQIVHLSSNWSATCSIERAEQIIDCGGILSIKAHMIKKLFRHTSADGLDSSFHQYLDKLFTHLERKYGDSLWWASMEEMGGWYEESHQALTTEKILERSR